MKEIDFLHDELLGEDDKVLQRYLKPDLLIVDDMGMKQLPRRSGEVLFEIIMRRYETRSTMMTSNWPLEDWGKLIGDVPSATAILDRFLHHAEALEFRGKSYRLRNQNDKVSMADDTAKGVNAPTGSGPKKRGNTAAAKSSNVVSESTGTCENVTTLANINPHPRLILKRPQVAPFQAPADTGGRRA